MNTFSRRIAALLIGIGFLASSGTSAMAEEQSISDRMLHHRAIDAAVWAMPLMNYKFYRDALIDAGVGPNDIGYYSKVQNWKFQTATPNNTTPYILAHWTVKDGPIVVEIPAATEDVGIFGTLMDAWQRPLDDVGAAGRDKGRGATYLLLPEDYTGPLLPGAMVYRQRTHNGFVVLRPIIADSSPESLAKATEYTKKVKIYPLATRIAEDEVRRPLRQAAGDDPGARQDHLPGDPRDDRGGAGRDLEPRHDGSAGKIGIRKGEPFKPSAETAGDLRKGRPEALEYMIDEYHRSSIRRCIKARSGAP